MLKPTSVAVTASAVQAIAVPVRGLAIDGDERRVGAAAAAVAMTALTLAVGHLFETTTFDMLVRALRAEPQRPAPWIAVGLVAGVAMEIKILAAPPLACCVLSVGLVGPRRRLASAQPWVAALIALALAAPNLIWQARTACRWPSWRRTSPRADRRPQRPERHCCRPCSSVSGP
jgi:4-amino-4-deoxy-L-arabinose transferase-like glycosyltransferase